MAPAAKKQKLSNGSVAAIPASGDNPVETATQQRRSLFVRSLPADTTSEALTTLFSDSYPIKHATAVIDPATKQCRGYGFVTFADAEDAQRAKKEFNGHTLNGRQIRTEIAEPRQRDAEKADSLGAQPAKHVKDQLTLPQPSRLIVRNLPWTIKTSDQLGKLFMSYGKIKQAYIPRKEAGLMAGFGFVVLRGRKNAEKALAGINGKEVDGRTLAVDWAVNKEVFEDLAKGAVDGEPESEQLSEDGAVDDDADDVDAEIEDEDHSDDASEDEGPVEFDSADEGAEEDGGVEVEGVEDRSDDRSATLFVRNLPFTCTDEDLEDHFTRFGKTRYARIVVDPGTERSKGTGFVCFYNKADIDTCLRGAPKRNLSSTTEDSKDAKAAQASSSILQNEEADPSGQYTMDGRVLQVSRAVDKSEANRLTQEGATHRHKRNEDKRRLYLLSEGTIASNTKLWEQLPPSERTMREASSKQRKTLVESNPSLHLSLTRLSIRNVPRTVGSKELKALAREAIVGFATDVKAGTRQKLAKEELARGGEEMQDMEKARKKSGKGIVKQAKVVFEGAGGSKVGEDTGAGRSRGYGFVEYYTHRSALMGLRWLNGHSVGYQVKEGKNSKTTKEEVQDRKKRLIVEFAIENAQVVMRRKDKEVKARERSEAVKNGRVDDGQADSVMQDVDGTKAPASAERKRGLPTQRSYRKSQKAVGKLSKPTPTVTKASKDKSKDPVDEKLARRNQIIGRKRAMRARRSGAN